MTEEKNSATSVPGVVNEDADSRYVAYCDILGFSGRILSDFDNTLKTYKEFGDLMARSSFKEVQTTMCTPTRSL